MLVVDSHLIKVKKNFTDSFFLCLFFAVLSDEGLRDIYRINIRRSGVKWSTELLAKYKIYAIWLWSEVKKITKKENELYHYLIKSKIVIFKYLSGISNDNAVMFNGISILGTYKTSMLSCY